MCSDSAKLSCEGCHTPQISEYTSQIKINSQRLIETVQNTTYTIPIFTLHLPKTQTDNPGAITKLVQNTQFAKDLQIHSSLSSILSLVYHFHYHLLRCNNNKQQFVATRDQRTVIQHLCDNHNNVVLRQKSMIGSAISSEYLTKLYIAQEISLVRKTASRIYS